MLCQHYCIPVGRAAVAVVFCCPRPKVGKAAGLAAAVPNPPNVGAAVCTETATGGCAAIGAATAAANDGALPVAGVAPDNIPIKKEWNE